MEQLIWNECAYFSPTHKTPTLKGAPQWQCVNSFIHMLVQEREVSTKTMSHNKLLHNPPSRPSFSHSLSLQSNTKLHMIWTYIFIYIYNINYKLSHGWSSFHQREMSSCDDIFFIHCFQAPSHVMLRHCKACKKCTTQFQFLLHSASGS